MPGWYYLDTSAVVKRYVAERGTTWVDGLTAAATGNRCWIMPLTPVEVLAAFQLRVRTLTLTVAEAQQAEQLFTQELPTLYQMVALDPAILSRARRLVTVRPLRAYDAVHLAAALELDAQNQAAGLPVVTLLSADLMLNRAAAVEGLSVDDPNQHP